MSLFLRYLFIATLLAAALLASYWRGMSAQRESDEPVRRKRRKRVRRVAVPILVLTNCN